MIQLVLLLLSGGAIVNVAVAWGLANAVSQGGFSGHPSEVTEREISWLRQMGWVPDNDPSAVRFKIKVYRYRPDRVVAFQTIEVELNELGSFHSSKWIGYFVANGFPSKSLEGGTLLQEAAPNTYKRATTYWILPINEHLYRDLPLRPVWPGFAMNTIFYAAILWVVFFVPGKLKRTLRRRRGQCPACGYPVGKSPVCTECGKPNER